MVIDIDSFLNEFDEKEVPQKETKEEEINLDFEKELKQKISNISENPEEKDFQYLYKAYEEIKRFDENLPKKLFGINQTSSSSLKVVGDTYSDGFLIGIRENKRRQEEFVRKLLNEIDLNLNNNSFFEAINKYNEAIKNYKLYPKEFMVEKLVLGRELRAREIILNQKFDSYKANELKKIKKEVLDLIKSLSSDLIPGNLKKVEEKVEKLTHCLENAPRVFYSDLIHERIESSKVLANAENYMKNEYTKDFEERSNLVHTLFDRYHKYYLKKDVTNALATYDEIVIIFERMPDIFIEKKVELYKQINSIFESMNSLLISNNVTAFLQTYHSSKLLDDTREYINYVNSTNRVNVSILLDFNEKLKAIPSSLKSERNDVMLDLDKLIQRYRPVSKNSENPSVSSHSNNQKNNTSNQNSNQSVKNNGNVNEMNSNFANPKLNINLSGEQKGDKVNQNMVQEIIEYYNRLINTSDKKEIGLLYKKIRFYLGMVSLNEAKKKEILDKIHGVINNKRLS